MGLTADEILAVLQDVCKPMEIPEGALNQAAEKLADQIAADVYGEATFVNKYRYRQVGWQEVRNPDGTLSYRWVDRYE